MSVNSTGTFSGSVALSGEGTHRLSAIASSIHGTSTPASDVSINFTAPPPSVVITTPAVFATVTTDTIITTSVVSVLGIAEVIIGIDGQAVANLSAPPYNYAWSLDGVSDGSHTITASILDNSGKRADDTRYVTVQKTAPPSPPVVTPYTGAVLSISPASSYGERPIIITGHSVDRVSGAPSSNAVLKLVLQVNGFQRKINFTTDSSGNFSYSFTPQSSDSGTYVVSVIHPDETVYPAQGQFSINRLGISPTRIGLQAARTIATTMRVNVSASSGGGVHGISLVAEPARQPSGSLPPGIGLQFPAAINLSGGASAPIDVQFTGSNDAAASGTIILTAYASDSGAAVRGSVEVDYQLSAPQPALYPQPTYIQTGLSQNQQINSSIQLTNHGLIAASGVHVQLLNNDGSSNVPAWIYLASTADLGTIEVGAIQAIQIGAAPTSDVSDGIYNFKLHITANNGSGGDIPIVISVTQAGTGSVLFKATDIYTNTLDSSSNTITGLAGATIQVQNEAVYSVQRTVTTDAQGQVQIDDLPTGRYTFRASAGNHVTATGRVTILPGVVATQDVFLDYNLISIEWSVTETTIQDHYDVTLTATYVAQVPAPVVVMEPTSINLPDMQVGEEYTGQFSISNYGLVRADDVVFTPPSSDAYFSYEFLGTVPSQIEAKQRIIVPFKITSLQALPGTDPTTGAYVNLNTVLQKMAAKTAGVTSAIALGTVGSNNAMISDASTSSATSSTGCYSYGTGPQLKYEYQCASGDVRNGAAASSFNKVYGPQCGNSGGGSTTYISSGRCTDPTGVTCGNWGGHGGPQGSAPLSSNGGNAPGCIPPCKTGKCCASCGSSSGNGNGNDSRGSGSFWNLR